MLTSSSPAIPEVDVLNIGEASSGLSSEASKHWDLLFNALTDAIFKNYFNQILFYENRHDDLKRRTSVDPCWPTQNVQF